MKCQRCEFENPADGSYCSKCGANLQPLPVDEDISSTRTYMNLHLDLEIGSVFADRYQVLEELGRGGMGKVYKVIDREVKEKIAIKVLRPEISLDEKIIERFRNELKLARKITHPNICRMYDLGKEKGLYYLTMEYVSGEDLKSTILRVGQISVGKALAVIREICKGLSEAHKMGVIHRDLKPHNIIIDRDGDVRIMDFGIAHSLKTRGMTETGALIGTPEYISPEQAVGEKADQRSDIYSLGVILFECLTGIVPFKADSAVAVALKHRSEPPPNPRDINPQIPEDVNRIILCCLEKDSDRRYQDVGQILDDISYALRSQPTTEKILPGKPPTATGQIGIHKQRRHLALLVSGLVVVGALAGYLVFREIRPHNGGSGETTKAESKTRGEGTEDRPDVGIPIPAEYGHLDINSLPSGAKVTLDGDEKGTTPTGKIRVPAGRYDLGLVLDGYEAIQTEIVIEDDRDFIKNYELTPTSTQAPAPAYSVRIESDPRDAEIYVDGVFKSKTPATVTSERNSLKLKVEKSLYEPWSGTVVLKPGPNDPVKIKLNRRQVTVTFHTEPEGAGIFIDDSPMGQTPETISLPAGSHQIRFNLAGYDPVEERLTITKDQPVKRTLRKIETVAVEFSPKEVYADIFVDDRIISRASEKRMSVFEQVLVGERWIKFQSETRGTISEKFIFEAGKKYRIIGIFSQGKIIIYEDLDQ